MIDGSHSIVAKHTVKFAIDGSIIREIQVNDGEKATPPEAPPKTGLTFEGWTPDINQPITMDTTFIAVYK